MEIYLTDCFCNEKPTADQDINLAPIESTTSRVEIDRRSRCCSSFVIWILTLTPTVRIPDKEDQDQDGDVVGDHEVEKHEDATQHNYHPFKAPGPVSSVSAQTGPDFAPNRAGWRSWVVAL